MKILYFIYTLPFNRLARIDLGGNYQRKGCRMKKVFLSVVVMLGVLIGADYSKMSNEELIEQAGKFPVEEAVVYHKELQKRVDGMTMAESREFFSKLRAAKNKNEENMKMKDLRERREQIRLLLAKAGIRPHYQSKMSGAGCDDCNQSVKPKKKHRDCECK